MAILQNAKHWLTAFVFAIHMAGYIAAQPQIELDTGPYSAVASVETATAAPRG